MPSFKLTSELFKGWIAIWIHTMLHPKNNIKQFWSSTYGDPFARRLPINTWMAIYSSLLHVKEELLDYMEQVLNQEFPKYWIPMQDISIDEILRRFKGRKKHKQYDPSKPAKRGLYWYAMVDSCGFKMRRSGVYVNLFELCKDFIGTLRYL